MKIVIKTHICRFKSFVYILFFYVDRAALPACSHPFLTAFHVPFRLFLSARSCRDKGRKKVESSYSNNFFSSTAFSCHGVPREQRDSWHFLNFLKNSFSLSISFYLLEIIIFSSSPFCYFGASLRLITYSENAFGSDNFLFFNNLASLFPLFFFIILQQWQYSLLFFVPQRSFILDWHW